MRSLSSCLDACGFDAGSRESREKAGELRQPGATELGSPITCGLRWRSHAKSYFLKSLGGRRCKEPNTRMNVPSPIAAMGPDGSRPVDSTSRWRLSFGAHLSERPSGTRTRPGDLRPRAGDPARSMLSPTTTVALTSTRRSSSIPHLPTRAGVASARSYCWHSGLIRARKPTHRLPSPFNRQTSMPILPNAGTTTRTTTGGSRSAHARRRMIPQSRQPKRSWPPPCKRLKSFGARSL
jgi:hypothetical protein